MPGTSIAMRAIAALMVVLAGSLSAAEAEDPDAAARRLVEMLRNGDFDERQEAEEKLREMGDPARRALAAAMKKGDSGLEFKIVGKRLLAYLSGATLIVQALDLAGKSSRQ